MVSPARLPPGQEECRSQAALAGRAGLALSPLPHCLSSLAPDPTVTQGTSFAGRITAAVPQPDLATCGLMSSMFHENKKHTIKLQNANLIYQESQGWSIWFLLALSINRSDVIIGCPIVKGLHFVVLSKVAAWIFIIALY